MSWSELFDAYTGFLRTGITLEEMGDYVEVTTPFVDHINDHVQFFVRRVGDRYELTDDGYTLTELEQGGIDIAASERRAEIVTVLLNGFGAQIKNGAIVMDADLSDLGRCSNGLVQAMLAMDGLHVLSQPRVHDLFLEDVATFLTQREVPYERRQPFLGKSGWRHRIDFYVPGATNRPDVKRLAARIHRCPEGYEGPCWGPTKEDEAIAEYRLTQVLNCPNPANHGPDGPFRYCPTCKWTEEWGTLAAVGGES